MLDLPTELLSVKFVGGAKNKTSVGGAYPFYIGSVDVNSLYGPFQCCGSQVIHGFSGSFRNPQEKEDLVCLWLRTKGDWLSWYGIAASYQWPGHEQEKSHATEVMKFLIDLGAKQVDERPNKYHDPYQMCLFVLDLIPSNENLKKYVTDLGRDDRHEVRNPFGHKGKKWVPNWWTKLDEEAQKKWIADRQVQLNRQREADRQIEENRRKAAINQRMWDFSFAQVDTYNQQYINLEETAKLLQRYGERSLMDIMAANFKKFIKIVEGE